MAAAAIIISFCVYLSLIMELFYDELCHWPLVRHNCKWGIGFLHWTSYLHLLCSFSKGGKLRRNGKFLIKNVTSFRGVMNRYLLNLLTRFLLQKLNRTYVNVIVLSFYCNALTLGSPYILLFRWLMSVRTAWMIGNTLQLEWGGINWLNKD